MLTRPSPDSVSENPLLESPYYQTWNYGFGILPTDTDWLLLTGENFSQLGGDDWAFLGP